jgi:hypothetical protein
MKREDYKVTKLPDDWRLSPKATRERTLFSALSPVDQKTQAKIAAKRARAKLWKSRQKRKKH